MEILDRITEKLHGKVKEANFEGANIVLYTDNEKFFKEGEGQIKKIVDEIKKRIELRADQKILSPKEATEKKIREIVPEEAEITEILFDAPRSIVVIEAKKPGLVIGKGGSILEDIRKETLWVPQVQRSPAIRSKITENIREVLYDNNNYRRKFLNDIGEKIYKGWNPDKIEEWVRVSFLGSGRQVGRSCLLLQTPNSNILLDCGIDVASSGNDKFPYFNIPEFDISQLDAIILSHAHLDHSGLLPYLYKMGYRGPVYMTAPTRDIAALLALDFIGVAYKQAAAPLFSSADIKEMVKHSICLNYNEVTDVTPDIRITLYNAGHVLGSAQVHINIGNGLHNFVYTGDMKYGKTRLLDPAVNKYTRVESIQVESTYGSKEDILPPRKDTEKKFIDMVRETIEKGGKVLLPELGLGHAQETLLRVEEAIRTGELPKIPMYIDGMIWDINAIHTAYPDFLSANIRSSIFQDKNPFVSDIFVRVASPQERKQVIEGGPCIVIATSGMLVGGASVEYFRYFADNPNNLIILSSYQGPGSLGRKLQDGEKVVSIEGERGMQEIKVNMRVELLSGLTPHSGRNELMSFFNNMYPKPKRILINHGEVSKSLDLASSLYKVHRVETTVPRNLEIVRLR
ncbi:MAG TPA: beta-CASP ribonuclease aCPSF1 [Candidatus Pacearchaeota archaeon]|nr:beta-CASP ribonuclease aCPSF1 [Candidatus Pacearchaeota archaeon]HOU79183.1 beta-CASP ribonuclease aCPSF1 [Candidatus Pacearchaeota archaeon]HQF82958.1 beta-CASP ribonuclease aCPSF1 [Candidatus Pacearchaeota archaeon]HQI57753.1 beta-CASP ribonuclease aCPSF1 [Candidatus Pacearchaeota archaeon]HQJ57681.1 beta-CASP ribonuclease aCPSF1 [Candidatus Pacearchaeota archaeon]